MRIYTREEAVNIIVQSWMNDFHQWDQDEVFRTGLKGLDDYSTKELEEELIIMFDEEVSVQY